MCVVSKNEVHLEGEVWDSYHISSAFSGSQWY
jgi:hypothetical protein